MTPDSAYPCDRCAASGPNREDVPCRCEIESDGPSVLEGCCEDHCTHPDDDGLYADEHCTAHCPLAASTCSPSSEPDSSTGSNDPSPLPGAPTSESYEP